MAGKKLTLHRTFEAPIAEVFQAFLSDEALKAWWSPNGYVAVEAHVDARVGGQYRLVMRAQQGSDTVYVHGFYREITPPTRLVFTHMFEHRSSDAQLAAVGLADQQTLVTVELHSYGEVTELVLVQAGLPTSTAEETVRTGWQGILDKLAAYVERADRDGTHNA